MFFVKGRWQSARPPQPMAFDLVRDYWFPNRDAVLAYYGRTTVTVPDGDLIAFLRQASQLMATNDDPVSPDAAADLAAWYQRDVVNLEE